MTSRITPCRAVTAALFCRVRVACLLLTAVVLMFAALPTSVSAQEAAASRKAFDVPAGPAANTLKAFIVQSGVQLLYVPGEVKDVRTKAVKGQFTPGEAIGLMLAETKLVSQVADNGAISVSRAVDPNVNRAIAETEKSGRPVKKSDLVENENGEKVLKLDTFEVFGRKTLNMDIQRTRNDSLPYVTFDRNDIDMSGASSLGEFFFRRLTTGNAGELGAIGSTGSIGGIQTNRVNLRGLSPTQTLILVDGRPLSGPPSTGGAPNQPNIDVIPLSAIERIEVLPVSASGLYGGGATGGAINIVLRRNYSGATLNATYSNSFDTDVARRRIDLNGGVTLENGRTSITYSASWADGNSLLEQDRRYRARGYQALLKSNPSSLYSSAFILPAGNTTNIASIAGNLRLIPTLGGVVLTSPRTYVPSGYNGPTSDNGAALAANAGSYNLNLAQSAQLGNLYSFFNAPEQKSAGLSFRREMAPWLELFVDARLNKVEYTRLVSPNAASFILLPVGAAGNPFANTISIRVPVVGVNGQASNRTDEIHVVAGAIFQLPFGWKAEIDWTTSRNRFESVSAAEFLSSAFSTAVTTGAVNVFRDLNQFPIDFAPYLVPVRRGYPYTGVTNFWSSRAAGSLPGPNWIRKGTLSLLAQYRTDDVPDQRQESTTNTASFFYAARSQSITSFSAEFRLPLLYGADVAGVEPKLEVDLAARYDRYETSATNSGGISMDSSGNPTAPLPPPVKGVNDSANPMASLVYRPVKSAALRATYSTGFLAPNLSQLTPSTVSTASTPTSLTDPLRGNEPIAYSQSIGGGNPNLKPEETETISAGVIFEPAAVKGLRLSADWSRIRQENAIQFPTFLSVLSQADFERYLAIFPERFVRGPISGGFSVGPIVAVDNSLMNFAQVRIEALDLAIDYAKDIKDSTLSFSLKATRNIEFAQQVVPNAAFLNTAGVVSSGVPRWRANGSVEWHRNAWSFVWTARYYDKQFLNTAHTVDLNQAASTFPSYFIHDVAVAYRFRNANNVWSNWDIRLFVGNVFNKEIPLRIGTLGGSPLVASSDLFLANYTVTLTKHF